MKKAILITFLCFNLLHVSKSQVADSIVHVSGRVFNESTMEYASNAEIWIGESYKIFSNDTGFFELDLRRATYFPNNSDLHLTIKNCDGWWKTFNISLSSNFDNNFEDIMLTICDSTPNPAVNEPVTLTEVNTNYYTISTNAIFEAFTIDGEWGFIDFFDPNLIYILDDQKGVYRLMLYDANSNLVSDNFVTTWITESEIPCNFAFQPYVLNTSDLAVYIYNYRKGDPMAELSWTCNGLPIEVTNNVTYVPTEGNNEICMISSIANTCELQKCETLNVLPAAQLCDATFQVDIDYGYTLEPLYRELNNGNAMDNADSMIITVNGMELFYSIIENRSINLQLTNNEVCLKVYRGECSDETCQEISLAAQPAPANCEVSPTYYYGDFSDNLLLARVPGNIVANSFSWDFGDGSTAVGPAANHVYTQSGSYVVTLTSVFNECTSTNIDTIVIDMESGCEEDFNLIKYSENRVYMWSLNASFNLPNQGAAANWLADGDIIGSGSRLQYQFDEDNTYAICLAIDAEGYCESSVCKDVDLSSDSLHFQVTLQGFEPNTDFSDSKLVLYEFMTTMGPNPVPINDDFELGFAVRDTIDIDTNGTGQFENLFTGFYGVKFIPGPAINDTTILPSYTQNQLLWQQMKISLLGTNPSISQYQISKRTLVDNYGSGLVIGNVNFGPFKLSEDFNPLDNANLILFHKNNPVRFLELNGNSTFQLSELSVGAYTLMLDLPGFRTSTASFIITEENQIANVSLNYDTFVFDDFTPTALNSTTVIDSPEPVLYPNPVSELLYLTQVNDQATIRITDLGGKLCNVPTINQSGNTLIVDVSQFQNGFYILTFTDTKGRSSYKRFVKG